MSAASCSIVTTGNQRRSGDTSGPRGARIHSGSRHADSKLKKVMGSLAYCRKSMRNAPQSRYRGSG